MNGHKVIYIKDSGKILKWMVKENLDMQMEEYTLDYLKEIII